MTNFKLFRKKNKLTQKDAAEYFGCVQGFISQIETGVSQIPDSFISKILADSTFDKSMIQVDPDLSDQKISSDYRLVPLINLDAVGGMGSDNDIMGEPEYVIGMIAFNGAQEGDKCLQVTGHSMEPACPPGSVVLIRKVERWNEYFGFGNIFVVLLEDGRRILKRITKSNEDPKNYVKCISFNEEYPEEDLPKNMIMGVWKVIKVLTDRGW